MVTSRRGAARLGCLFTLLLLATAGYYGSHASVAWWHYLRLMDRMKTVARFSQDVDDTRLLAELRADVDSLGIPPAAKNFRIVRTGNRKSITISTEYVELIEIPFSVYRRTFRPRVTYP